METMKRVAATLNENQNIDYETKRYILLNVYEFHFRFTGVSLENLIERLKTVTTSSSSLLYNASISYVPHDNELVTNKKMFTKEETDRNFDTMKAVLSMITAKGNGYGFNSNAILDAINAGFREIIATNLARYTGKGYFNDEQCLVNLIFTKDDFDTLFDAFINDKPDFVIKNLLGKFDDKDKLMAFLEQMNNNMMTRERTKKSRLPHLCKQAREMFKVNENYIVSSVTMASFSDLVYDDIEQMDEIVKQQIVEWTRGGLI